MLEGGNNHNNNKSGGRMGVGKLRFQLFNLSRSGLGVKGTHNTSCCGKCRKAGGKVRVLLKESDSPEEEC